MKSVIVFMLLWIGENTNYNVDLAHPTIILLSEKQLEETYGGTTTGGGALKGFYSVKKDIIYLKDDFDIHDPWKKSVLFHELFHYVQDQNGFKGACVQEWEKESYPLQRKYMLQVHGLKFKYDELWYKMVSTCPIN